MRKVMIASIAATMASVAFAAPIRVEHEGEEIDLTPRKIKPPPDPEPIYLPKPREPEPIYLRPPRVEHKDKSPALARMLKSKGRK